MTLVIVFLKKKMIMIMTMVMMIMNMKMVKMIIIIIVTITMTNHLSGEWKASLYWEPSGLVVNLNLFIHIYSPVFMVYLSLHN